MGGREEQDKARGKVKRSEARRPGRHEPASGGLGTEARRGGAEARRHRGSEGT